MPSASTFAQRVLLFNNCLEFREKLPPHIRIMNPFRDNRCAIEASLAFYTKYYADDNLRNIILGINPGRFGAGLTGVPFTDPRMLKAKCGIEIAECPDAREPSSEFIYEVIDAMGGPGVFYKIWYINSICPLGFIHENDKGRWVNYNYYDTRELEDRALPFILRTLREQLALGIRTHACICLGLGKNFAFLEKINQKYDFFDKIVPLEHPRYILQYKSRQKKEYVAKYVDILNRCAEGEI